MIYVALHLHAYQPPTQPENVIRQIFEESYEPVIYVAENNPAVFFSLDITRSLLERLPEEFIQRLKKLYQRQKMELVNVPAYHYLLPLVPDKVAIRQLKLNEESYRENLIGDDLLPGVFLPEMAYSPRLPSVTREAGYSWLMADDLALAYQNRSTPERYRIPPNQTMEIDNCGILLRSRMWSDYIGGGYYEDGAHFIQRLITEHTKWVDKVEYGRDSYLILALDFETFGHHRKGAIQHFLIPFLEEIKREGHRVETASLSFIHRTFPYRGHFNFKYLPASSWSTGEEDLKSNIPFPFWDHPQNSFHQTWKKFMEVALNEAPAKPYPELQKLLDQAFYSCSPWWACREGQGARSIAARCLPMFQEIINLQVSETTKTKLVWLYSQMKDFAK